MSLFFAVHRRKAANWNEKAKWYGARWELFHSSFIYRCRCSMSLRSWLIILMINSMSQYALDHSHVHSIIDVHNLLFWPSANVIFCWTSVCNFRHQFEFNFKAFCLVTVEKMLVHTSDNNALSRSVVQMYSLSLVSHPYIQAPVFLYLRVRYSVRLLKSSPLFHLTFHYCIYFIYCQIVILNHVLVLSLVGKYQCFGKCVSRWIFPIKYYPSNCSLRVLTDERQKQKDCERYQELRWRAQG